MFEVYILSFLSRRIYSFAVMSIFMDGDINFALIPTASSCYAVDIICPSHLLFARFAANFYAAQKDFNTNRKLKLSFWQ